MASLHIASTQFKLTNLHDQAYQLDVEFQDAEGALVSKKGFVFMEQTEPESAGIKDIYSQNGVSTKAASDLFKKSKKALFTASDANGLLKAAQKWSTLEEEERPTVLVLDLKDTDRSYRDKDSIAACEQACCAFLQGDAADPGILAGAKKTHTLLKKSLPVGHLLCEGSLKCDLLSSQFSDAEAAYFLSKKGGKDLCQYAEFYMNGFKLGQGVKGVVSQPYFLPVLSQETAFQPAHQSTVWYPAAYKDLYAIDSPFYEVMKPVFAVSGSFDEESQISSITVGKKG